MRAWLCLAFGSDRQYAGNMGYRDEVSKCYRYDSFVPNHKRIRDGDILFLRDRTNFLGTATVVEIRSFPGKKAILRCPECKITGIKTRATKRPKFRCHNGHEFDVPVEESVGCTQYEAHFGSTFRRADGGVSVEMLKEIVLRPSDQLSIQELNLEQVRKFIGNPHSQASSEPRFGRKYVRAIAAQSTRERVPFEVDPDAVDRATSTHAELQNLFAESLKQIGIEPVQPAINEPPFDIGWQYCGRIFICEVKSLTDDNEERQLRYGLGQILRYRHQLVRQDCEVSCVMFVERRPREYDAWSELCSTLHVILMWPEKLHTLHEIIIEAGSVISQK